MELTCYYSEAREKREGGDSGRGVRNGREGVFQMPSRNGPGLEAEYQLPLGGVS